MVYGILYNFILFKLTITPKSSSVWLILVLDGHHCAFPMYVDARFIINYKYQ